MFALKEAVCGMLRTRYMALISVVTITAALILLGTAVIAAFYAYGVVNKVRGCEEVNVYLSDDMPDGDMLALDENITSMREVEATRIVSKEDAVKEFERVFGNGLLSMVEKNPLPRSIVVTMAAPFRTADAMEQFSQRIRQAKGVESVEYGREWMSRMDIFFLLFILVEALFVTFIVSVCILIISNTITLTVIARKETIEIMRLVGATDSFIRRPFYYEGLVQGLFSGVCAFGIMYGGWMMVQRAFPGSEVYAYMFGLTGAASFVKPWFVAAIIPAGGFLGLLGSFAAVQRTV